MFSLSSIRGRVHFLHFLAAILVAGLPVYAQFQRGAVVGTVTDQTGATVSKAKVTLKNLGTNEERSGISDERGDYTFPSLLPGAYQVTA
jgi:hypothetical protein